jgi:hypothetical protein
MQARTTYDTSKLHDVLAFTIGRPAAKTLFFRHKQTMMNNVLGINGFLDKIYEHRNKHHCFLLLILQNTTVE